MKEEGRLARPRRRVRRLIFLLGFLAVIFAVRLLPHEPRLFLRNESCAELDGRVIRSGCGDIPIPRLADGRSARLELAPRPECVYEFPGSTLKGDTLRSLIELGRERKEDVEIVVGIDFLEADLTKRYKLW